MGYENWVSKTDRLQQAVRQARRWGLDFALEPDSRLHAENLLFFLRTAGELPIQLRRVGWSSIGLPRQLQDTLAAHHHQVTLLVKLTHAYLAKQGCVLDERAMLEMGETHDLSEWGGGDAGVKRAKKDPEYKRQCRIIEKNNRDKLAQILGNGFVADRYLKVAEEEMRQSSDEAKIVKLIDALEALLHLRRVRPIPFNQDEDKYYEEAIVPQLNSIANTNTKQALKPLIEAFRKQDQINKLGQVPINDADFDLTQEERLVRTWNELQMMKHVERTAWAVGGLEKSSMDTLAEHGHATSIGVWAMITALEEFGIKIDMKMALHCALLQESGKIYGGDVAIAQTDPDDELRQAAYYLRRGNYKSLFSLIADIVPDWEEIHEDCLSRSSDAAKIMMVMSRVMDYIHYDLVYHPSYQNRYRHHTNEKIIKLIKAIKDPLAREELERVIKEMLVIIESGRLRRTVHSLIPSPSPEILK